MVISDFEASHGRQVRWQIRARNATRAIRERWEGASWIIELVSTGRRDDKHFHHVHYFITTLRTSPKSLLRLVRQRWVSKIKWHWPRDSQLGEDAHCYSQRNGVQVLALLRTLALSLLRCNGFRSIRAGLMAVRMTFTECSFGLAPAQQKQLEVTFSQPWAVPRLRG